jgi:hypothetical protein
VGAVAELMVVDDVRLPQNCENEKKNSRKNLRLGTA